jgi:hypothetical protein
LLGLYCSETTMKRHVVLIITFFQLFGTVGVPVVAFSCVDCGEGGVVPYLSWSPGSCYADACCGGEQEPPSTRIEGSTPCCMVDDQLAAENEGVLVADQKYRQDGPLPLTSKCPDVSPSDVGTTPAPPTPSIFDPPINRPLII